ncbi:hypothetical protein G9A89_005614 [Geosiphon pyriformis]|nr:hypothetical protein G9A89_005614 [Geosiphon pyriformis]
MQSNNSQNPSEFYENGRGLERLPSPPFNPVTLPQWLDPQFDKFFSILPQNIGVGTSFDQLTSANIQPITLEEFTVPLKFDDIFSILSQELVTEKTLEQNCQTEFHEVSLLQNTQTVTSFDNNQPHEFHEVSFSQDYGNEINLNNYQPLIFHEVTWPQAFKAEKNLTKLPEVGLQQDFESDQIVNHHNSPDLLEVTLQDLMEPSFKVDYLLSNLSKEQLAAIEKNLNKAKKRKLNIMKTPQGGRLEKKTRKSKPTPLKRLPTPPKIVTYKDIELVTPQLQQGTNFFRTNVIPKSDTNLYSNSEGQFVGLETPLTTSTGIVVHNMNNFWRMDPVNQGQQKLSAQQPLQPLQQQEIIYQNFNFISSESNKIPLPEPTLGFSYKPKAEVPLGNIPVSNEGSGEISSGLEFKAQHPQQFPIQSSQREFGQQNFNFMASKSIISKPQLDSFDQSKARPTSIPTANAAVSTEVAVEFSDGIEWMIFNYSHNQVLKSYRIRTDIQTVDISFIDEQFKRDNCIYPRAFCLPEAYTGNRWIYETECNALGWILAFLNREELSGRRGLIQRAVDSFRNRQPGSKSRRVARQEKVMNGTLRKRKASRPEDEDARPSKRKSAISHKPKTVLLDDIVSGTKIRIKINVEEVDLNEIDSMFKRNNCVYPRAAFCTHEQYNGRHYEEEVAFNELAWKLAWLNPRGLANKKRLLQRAVDLYRARFTDNLKPRSARSSQRADFQATSFNNNPENNTGLANTETPLAPAEIFRVNGPTPLLEAKSYSENVPSQCHDGLLLGCERPNDIPIWHFPDLPYEQNFTV